MDGLDSSIAQFQKQKNPLRVLLIEDNSLVQMAHSGMLTMLGCLVDVAERGEDALVMLKCCDYQLVLTDIDLPGISGIETIAKFYQYKESSKTPAIAVTMSSNTKVTEECLAVGMRKVLRKPVGIDELARVVDSIRAELKVA